MAILEPEPKVHYLAVSLRTATTITSFASSLIKFLNIDNAGVLLGFWKKHLLFSTTYPLHYFSTDWTQPFHFSKLGSSPTV